MSHHRTFRAARRIGDWPSDEPVEVSVVCRRTPAHDHERLIEECEHAAIHERPVWRGREFDAVFGASPVEMARVAATLERHGFEVRRADRCTRLVTARGNARAVARAFGISLGATTSAGRSAAVTTSRSAFSLHESLLSWKLFSASTICRLSRDRAPQSRP